MKNEDSRGLRTIYKWRNSVPKFQDSLAMKNTTQQAKNTGKQENNALKHPTHNRRREAPQKWHTKAYPNACEKITLHDFSPLEAHDFSPS